MMIFEPYNGFGDGDVVEIEDVESEREVTWERSASGFVTHGMALQIPTQE